MPDEVDYYNRKWPICSNIRSLLTSLTKEPLKCDEYDAIATKIEYWIEYVLREDFSTVDELVEGVSYMAWEGDGSFANVGKFFREFRDAPHRSERAKTFVAQLCSHMLRWFAIASTEGQQGTRWVSRGGESGFIRAASFVGYLIEWGLLSHELVRRHLTKPLTNSYYSCGFRADAIYKLFIAAGNTLLQGLLEPDDVRACFSLLDTRFNVLAPTASHHQRLHTEKLKEFRAIHDAWMQRKEEQTDPGETEEHQGGGGEDTVPGDVTTEVKTPVAFVPQDLPSVALNIEIPSSIWQDTESSSVINDSDSTLETFTNVSSGTVSPTLSISTVSDLTPTEFGEEFEHDEKQTAARHDTYYFEDGNAEIACGRTIFRVHSSVISLSSSKLREMLSQSALLDAPTPEGRPRITTADSAEDFANLLEMIYTPGFPARHEVPEFQVFASLLRMTTKYGLSKVRDQLVRDLKGAYPTKWEDFRSAKILGEDIFRSPKPHPNVVLNLFESQNVKFAIPFAAYRASIGGFQALMGDKPGTILSRRTLASIVQGMCALSTSVSKAARIVAYGGCLLVCPDRACTLNVGINPVEKRVVALEKVYLVMIDNREGGLLNPPVLGDLLCAKCADRVAATHEAWGSSCWERFGPVFGVPDCWDDL